MSERLLSDLPGYQPLGTVDPIEAYLAEKRGVLGDEAAQYLSNTALQGGGLRMGPDAIEHIAAEGRDEVMRRQGTAPYVAALARRLVSASNNVNVVSAPTEKTALTTLFSEEYGVDLAPYMQQSTNMLSIVGMCDRSKTPKAPVVGLDYMAIRETHGNTFWQLTVDGVYGFVNMRCVRHDFNTMPLSGMGNIAAIPGVEQALSADVAFIEKNNTARG
jgi:hypothetical protein